MTAVKTEFQIAAQVIERVSSLPFDTAVENGRVDCRCYLCRQSVFCMARNYTGYHTSINELRSGILVHMMQAHGWTREEPSG